MEDKSRHKLAIYIEKMNGLSPLKKLNQGYAYVEDQAGRTFRSVSQAQTGDRLRIYVSDGTVEARVEAAKAREDLSGSAEI